MCGLGCARVLLINRHLSLPPLGAGICTVFGDPHYKTFDGKFFSFQGMCKYQLTSDCVGHTFSIRVTNDGRNTKSSSWTKTVTLKVNNLKVNLGQKMRVKVNGTRVDLPFVLYSPSVRSLGTESTTTNAITALVPISSSSSTEEYLSLTPEVEIRMTEEGVSVMTRIGVQLLWDGTNFLQVQAPVNYKNRLCGLCGNYNGVSRDDFRTRRGVNMNETSVWQFANSWRVGGKRQCSEKFNENYGRKNSCKYAKKKGMCSPLQGHSWIFDSCTERVNPSNYINSCSKDMCECESDLCYCDSFTAYAHECKRMGVQLPDWRAGTGCTLQAIRNGALAVQQQQQHKYPRWAEGGGGHRHTSANKSNRGGGGAAKHKVSVAAAEGKKKPLELQLLEEKIPAELIHATENQIRRGRLHGKSQHRRRSRLRSNRLSAGGGGRLGAAGKADPRIPLPLKD